MAILDQPDRAVAESVRREVRRRLDLDLDGFRAVVVDQVLANPEPDENVALWQLLRQQPLPDALAATGHHALGRSRIDTVANLNADRASASGPDPLGIQADVSAFARLICLEQSKPPLSIGLFGEWGSGKSSFMERLQATITKLTQDQKDARKALAARASTDQAQAAASTDAVSAPRFVENVVQIRFNAWHYADANLWASLTAEFFDQLRRGGYEGQRSSDYLALIGKVADRVRSLEASSQQAQLALTDAERKARDAAEALADARKKLAASDLALASEQLAKTFDAIRSDKDNADKLKQIGRQIYRDDLGKDLDGFSAAVAEASSLPGKAALIGRVIVGGGRPTALAVLAVVLIAAAGVGWRLGDPTEFGVLIQRAIAWGGGAFAALASIWQAMRLAKPILDGAWAYAKAVETARKELAKEVENKESDASKADSALKQAREAAARAKAPLARFGEGATAGAPGTILRYFLFEDTDVRDYDKHVGLVSRARRSFEQLDAIFAAARDGHAAGEKRQRGETLDEVEVKALQRFEAMKLDEHGVKIPDRIVLYIDDLDRCTHQQVYDVLQAIHLLLAFELFVVVVGVDVRWVEEAVSRQFVPVVESLPEDASTADRDAARQRAETERRKRAIDYLEKIFQLPFWLRRLSTEGDKGGSYGAYVTELLKANLEASQAAGPPPGSKASRRMTASDEAASGPGSEEGAFDEDAAETHEFAAAAEELASIDLALATVRLTQAEVDFLASPEIGAIAFKSPRSVKRMLNVYRIVRARMSEAELDEFLGRNRKFATWPMAALFAAIETGQPVEIADAVYKIISYEPKGLLQVYLESFVMAGPPKSMPKDVFDAIKLVASSLPQFLEMAGKIQAMATPSMTLMTEDYLAMARLVRRYSFNRYH